MTTTPPPVLTDRLETVLLAKLTLSKATLPTAAMLAKLTQRYMPTTLTEPQWRELVEAALQGLKARTVITADELKRRVGPHTATKWDQWKDRLLPALALGLRIDDAKALRRLGQTDGWVSAIAARVLRVWADGPPPLFRALCDAVVWRELGLAGSPETCPPAIRAHFLRNHIEIQGGSPAQLVRQIAAKAVGAPRLELVAIRDSLVGSWLVGQQPGASTTHSSTLPAPASPADASHAPASHAPSLIDAVRAAAQAAEHGVFGDRKVFISSVWDTLRARPEWAALALDDFKARLVAAHRAQQLELARADLVSAMDPALVAASETLTDGATFHFIIREPH